MFQTIRQIVESIFNPKHGYKKPKNVRFLVTYKAYMPTCKICGKESKTMRDHEQHEKKCEEAAQSEVWDQKRANELAALAREMQCPTCGRVHVFAVEAEKCEKEWIEQTAAALDNLYENGYRIM